MKKLMLLFVAVAAFAQMNAAQALPQPNDPNSPCAKANPPKWCLVATGPIIKPVFPKVPRIPLQPVKPFPFPLDPVCLSCPAPGVLDNIRMDNPRIHNLRNNVRFR